MRNVVATLFVLALWFSCGVGFSQSLDKARLLYSNKLYEDAKRELVAVAVGNGPDEERAEALNLLGAIAIDEGDYDAAIRNWTEATTKFPGTAAAKEAAAKIPLAEKLASTQHSTPPNREGAPERELPGTVLVAGSAPESPEYADQAVLEFMNFLTSKEVRAKSAFSGRSMDATLPNLLERAGRSGAASVLYVFIHFHGMENMRVECYSADGKRLWEEKVSASLGLSPAGMTESFVRRMKKKLEPHIGGACFPVNVEQS
jgi:tetratricopeptide (TPR) repeat protein